MSETNFFWDQLSDNILQERDEAGAVTAEYTTEPELYGNLISQNRGGAESQHHFDALGSTLALTDDNQQVTDTYGYTGFGQVTEHAGSTANPFRYVGQRGYYSVALSAQYLVRRRWLLPGHARWRSIDPTRPRFDSNWYSYVNNLPTLIGDPAGLGESITFECAEDVEKCGGACLFGKAVVLKACKITKLEVLAGSDMVCYTLIGALICAEITRWITSANDKSKDKEWVINKCSAAKDCVCAEHELKAGKQRIDLKDEIIDSRGKLFGADTHCIMKVSGTFDVEGDGFALVKCVVKPDTE